MLTLVELSSKYRSHLNDMMNEWCLTNEEIVPYSIRRIDFRDFDRYLQGFEEERKGLPGFVPATTLFPVFPAIVTSHITIGGSYNVSKRVSLSVAIESALNSKETSSDPSGIQSEFSGSTSQLGTTLGHVSLNWKL